MPKKSKRKVSTVTTPASAHEVMEVRTTEAPAAAPSRAYSRRTTTAVEFNPDYTYVIKDLKRIGTLAGTFFVILVALSFILPLFQR